MSLQKVLLLSLLVMSCLKDCVTQDVTPACSEISEKCFPSAENTRHSGTFYCTFRRPTSCLTGLELTKQVKLLFIQQKQRS